MKKSKWQNAHFCVHCNKELTQTQRLYSNGTCPLCNYKDWQAISVVRCIKTQRRWVQYRIPFWNFWEWCNTKECRGYWEYNALMFNPEHIKVFKEDVCR